MCYQIRVQGHLGERWQAALDGAAVQNLPGGEALITVTVPDQSALYGVLTRLQGLGVPLLSLNRVNE